MLRVLEETHWCGSQIQQHHLDLVIMLPSKNGRGLGIDLHCCEIASGPDSIINPSKSLHESAWGEFGCLLPNPSPLCHKPIADCGAEPHNTVASPP